MFVFGVSLVWGWGGDGGCWDLGGFCLERILMLFEALFFLLTITCFYGRGGAELCRARGAAGGEL